MNRNDDFRTPLCSTAATTNENADLQVFSCCSIVFVFLTERFCFFIQQILFEREYEKNMLNFILEIQRNDDVESSSTFFDHDESDLHGQQATEASDGKTIDFFR